MASASAAATATRGENPKMLASQLVVYGEKTHEGQLIQAVACSAASSPPSVA
jgi:hypothetical protein